MASRSPEKSSNSRSRPTPDVVESVWEMVRCSPGAFSTKGGSSRLPASRFSVLKRTFSDGGCYRSEPRGIIRFTQLREFFVNFGKHFQGMLAGAIAGVAS
jgi:hypothetical protein